jgi:hypothetical protein
MTVRHIIEVFKSAFRKQVKTPLGRWNLDNHTHTTLKINYANEDHCGSCAEYMIQKQQLQIDKTRQQQKEEEEMYMYMIGPESLPDTHNYKL